MPRRVLPGERRCAHAASGLASPSCDVMISAAAQHIGEDERPRSVGIVATIRAFAVMSGGPAIGALAVLASVWSAGRALRRRRPVRPLAALTIAATIAYATVLRPWSRRWGASAEERTMSLPGDELVETPGIQMTRAVSIDAPTGAVWAWLAQIGQDRGGFYSYEWLENLAGCQMRNADRIHAEWQQRAVGDTVRLHPATGLTLARFEPGHSYAFDGAWYFALQPINPTRTRLLARSRVPRGLPSLAYAVFIEVPHFIMERKMLLGIKTRAERATLEEHQR
jgi:hypothetical protein